MIDFLKMQKDYIEKYWKKEMRIGSPDVNNCNVQIRESDALIMLDYYAIARIPSARWVYIKAAEGQRMLDLSKIWASILSAETVDVKPVYDMTRGKDKIRVYEDKDGRKHGFNPTLLDRYKIDPMEYVFKYSADAHALIVYMWDDPVYVQLEIAPKSIGLE